MSTTTASTARRTRVVVRRTGLVAAVAFGLLFMHAGIGPAAACGEGMSMTTSQTMTGHETGLTSPPGHDPAPGAGHAAAMCVSTPAQSETGATHTPPAHAGRPLPYQLWSPAEARTLTAPSGRSPPRPDLVSVLQVDRQ